MDTAAWNEEKPLAVVTGASGFIGRHLTRRLLESGYRVLGLSRNPSSIIDRPPGLNVVEYELGNDRSLQAALNGARTLFHLAGFAHDASEKAGAEPYFQVNLEGTRLLMTAAAGAGVKAVVFFSSVKAMGESTEGCQDESAPPRPTTAYGRSKLAAEGHVLAAGRAGAMHAVCLRLPLVYGPGVKGNFLKMMKWVDRGIFPPLPDTSNLRSMVYVGNAVEAALCAAAHPTASGKVYIVADARPYTTREIYDTLCRGLGRPAPGWEAPAACWRLLAAGGDLLRRMTGRRWGFDSEALQKLTGTAWYSSERISRDLGYRPAVDLAGAVPEIVSWFRGKGTGI